MTTRELIQKIAKTNSLSTEIVKQVFDTSKDIIVSELKKGNKVNVYGLTTFKTYTRANGKQWPKAVVSNVIKRLVSRG